MKITAATINRELAKRGIPERIRQGKGYVYFDNGDSHTWFSSSIATAYVANLIVPGDLDATMKAVLDHHEWLKTTR